MKLLLVEDHDATRRTMVRAIHAIAPEAHITEESDGLRAEHTLRQTPYDCAFLDHQLPGKNGLDILRAVREAGITTPIVLVTARGDEELAVQAMKAGATDYLPKSRFSIDSLHRCLVGAIRLHEAHLQTQAARQQLRASQQQLARILETNIDGIMILDRHGQFLFVNPAAENILGLTQQQVARHRCSYGRPVWQHAYPDGRSMPEDEHPVWRVLQTGQPLYNAELEVTRPDGARVVVSANVAPLKEPDGSISGVVASLRDITAQKRAEEALRRAEQFTRAILDSLPDPVVVLDHTGLILARNCAWAGFADKLSVGNQFVEGANYLDLIQNMTSPDGLDGQTIAEAIRAILAGHQESFVREYQWDCHGERRWFVGRALRLRRAGPPAVVVVNQDVTELKRTEEALRESRELFQRFMSHAPIAAFLQDQAGRLLYLNETAARLLDINPQEWYGRLSSDYWPPDIAAQIQAHDREVLQSGQARSFIEQLPHRDGLHTWLSFKFLIADARGRKLLAGAAVDITDRQRAEEKLREAELRYRSLFEQSPLGILVIDPETQQICDFNSAAHKLLDYSRDEFAGRQIQDYEAGESPQETEARIRRILQTGSEEFETRLRTRSGEIRDALVSVRRLVIGGRTMLHVILQDITERNRLKEQLLHSQKMEAIGRLAGGVAHDFNNLLAVIGGYSESLQRRLPPDSPLRLHAEEIQKAADRGGSLTRQLLAFSRHQIIQPQPLDLNRAIADLYQMLRRVISDSIQIILQTDDNLHLIEADPGQITQIVVNLALNARDAMPDGGCLTIQTANLHISRTNAVLYGLSEGHYASLTVSDTGVGMDAQTRQRIFDPFFTTKDRQGTGLGLSIVYGIVQQYRGGILVDSQPAQGSRFQVLLPAAQHPPDQHPA